MPRKSDPPTFQGVTRKTPELGLPQFWALCPGCKRPRWIYAYWPTCVECAGGRRKARRRGGVLLMALGAAAWLMAYTATVDMVALPLAGVGVLLAVLGLQRFVGTR